MKNDRSDLRRLALGVLAGSAAASALAWAFGAYFRPDLLIGFANWVRACF
jgi:hypothetical protein